MKIKSNFEKGKKYWYASKSMMACEFMLGSVVLCDQKYLPLFRKKPNNGCEYHRVEINVIRTKKEAKDLDNKYKKIREGNLKKKGDVAFILNNQKIK